MTVSPTPPGTSTLGGSTPTHTALHTQIANSVNALEISNGKKALRSDLEAHVALDEGAHGMTADGASLVAAANVPAMRDFLGVAEAGQTIYIGIADTDGSWRIARDGDDLVMQRRESAVWVTKLKVQA